MQLSTWRANTRLVAAPEILHLVWFPTGRYQFQRIPRLVHMQSQLNPFHTIPLTLSVPRSLLSRFSDFKSVWIFLRPCVLHSTPILFYLIWWRLQVAYSMSRHLGPKLSPKHAFLEVLPPALKAARWLWTAHSERPISWTKISMWRWICLEVSVLLLREKEHTCSVTCKSETEGPDKFQRMRRAYAFRTMKILFQSILGTQCKVHLDNPQ